MKEKHEDVQMYEDMIKKVSAEVTEWNMKLEVICDRLKSETSLEFHELQNFVLERLSSHACSMNQGYVMNGFELDSEMAKYLFLEQSSEEDDREFDELTKPDFVIIMNRIIEGGETCEESKSRLGSHESSVPQSEMKYMLQNY